MKIIPIVTAIVVSALLFLMVFERDTLLNFAGAPSAPASDQAATTEEEPVEAAAPETGANPGVRVVAMHSVSQTIDSAVILRGRTEAARHCRLDPGTRQASLAEAKARLTEAEGRVPEAEAAVAEAIARVREAEINLNAAQQLSQDGFASETRLVSAQAAMDAANAGVQRANSGVTSAQAGIEAAAAAVASAEREIERLTILAPFSGLLETDTAELGSLMQPGTPCATIIQLDPIKLVGFVPEADIGKVTVGARAGARLTTGEEIRSLWPLTVVWHI